MIQRDKVVHTVSVVLLRVLASHEARDTAKHRGRPQGRSRIVPLAVGLHHQDTNLEGAVDLALLHEISPYNSILNYLLATIRLGQRRRAHRTRRGRGT